MKKIILILLAFSTVMGVTTAEFAFEFGEKEVGASWTPISLTHSFSNPIVVAKPVESCNDSASEMCNQVIVRMRNVTSNSFELMLQYWGARTDDFPPKPWAREPETGVHKVQYLVIEKGHYSEGGLEIEAGEFDLEQPVGDLWPFEKVDFMQPFSTTPILITSVTTFNGPEPVTTRNKNIKVDSFMTKLREREYHPTTTWGHAKEKIHYIAITPGTRTINGFKVVASKLSGVTDNASTVVFPSGGFDSIPIVVADIETNNGDDSCIIRYNGKTSTSVKFFIAEEDSSDQELTHQGEQVGYIAIGEPPFAEVNAVIKTDKDSCDSVPCTIQFNGLSSTSNVGSIVSYSWDFGDGKTGAGGTVSHTYNGSGYFTVKLTVKDEAGNEGTAFKTIFVGTSPKIKASFTASPESCTAPCEVQFDASASTGNIVSYNWDFGDGTPIISGPDLVTTSHTYESGGEFTVKLTVKDAKGNSDTAERTISVEGPSELEAIIKTDKDGCPYIPCTIQFDASQSTGSIISYNWDFGDGETGTGMQAEHTFNDYGEFVVTLTISDGTNTDTATVAITIGCSSNSDCPGGDGCYNGVCIHPELTINGSADQLLPFRDSPRETTVFWTITNVGEHAAIITEINPTGCNGISCEVEVPENGVQQASFKEPEKNKRQFKILLQGLEISSVTATPNPFEQGSTTTFVAEGSGIAQINVKIWDSAGRLVFESGFVDGTTFVWDGKNNDGKQLAIGAYIYKILATNGSETVESEQDFIYIKSSAENGGSSSEFKFEYGEVEATLEWQTVTLSQSFSNPIVVAKPIESCTTRADEQCDMVVVRIKNVMPNSFEIKLQEWGAKKNNALSMPHRVEYLVAEEGHYNVNGFEIEAGKFETDHGGMTVSFKEDFPSTPVLITSIVTFNGEEPAVTRNFNPCKNGTQYYPGRVVLICGDIDFITKIQEEENRWFKWGHKLEEIHYIAITPGRGTINGKRIEVSVIPSVTDVATEVPFQSKFASEPIVIADMQTTNGDESCMLRYSHKTSSSIKFFIAEEDSADEETTHKAETVGYIAIGEKSSPVELTAVIETDKDSCEKPPCTVIFDATSSTGNIVSFDWDFGDGNTAEGPIVEHTFEDPGTYEVSLVVTDDSGSTDEAMKTIVVGSGTEPTPSNPPEGIILYPYETLKITQRISNITPGEYNLGLEVKYTDLYGASDKVATNWQPVTLQIANIDSDKFHIKLDLYDQNFCIGSDGTLGLTGNSALPKIKLSWDFVGDNAISIDECDKKPSNDFIYCDPTQFSIELAQKLHRIEELANQGDFAGLEQYKSFKAYLIGDNYSEDFQKDFAYFYTHGFFAAPSWFTSEPTPWHIYFADPERLTFEPREITGGLYNITLDFNFEAEEYNFFNESKPTARIKVRFEKIHDVGVDVPYSPFYFLPFNGLVGTMREDEDGKVERKGYGVGFTNDNEPIVLNVAGNSFIDTQASGGRDTYKTAIYRDFAELNIDPRGRVFEIDFAHRTMRLYASQAMPVIMGIQSSNNTAEAFYQLYAGDNVFGESLSTLSYWTGIATSPSLGCGDFYGNALPYKVPDSSASSFDECCAMSEYHLPAFGFRWPNVADNESIFLSTVFYLPYDQRMSLSSACADNISVFASQSGISTSPGEALSLETMLRIQKLQDVLNLIESELVCVAPERSNLPPVDNKYVFFWNEQKIEEQLEQAKARIAEQWGFNWENYACTTSH